MPRATAAPDPVEELYGKKGGKEYRISARRDGFWQVTRDGQVVLSGKDPMTGFPGHTRPSNQRQAEALQQAKQQIESMTGPDW